MKARFTINLFALLMALVLFLGCSKVPKFDHYGVYIKTNDGFREIKGFAWSGNYEIYQNSRNYNKKEILFETELEIYVYSPKAKTNQYQLIIPENKNRNGDFWVDLRKSPKREITVEPIEKIDDMVLIKSKIINGTFILHVKEEDKGYVFNAKRISKESEAIQTLSPNKSDSYKKELEKTIHNWISLLNESKYVEFVENFKTPSMVELLKDEGEFEDLIEDLKFDKTEIIEALNKMLEEELTVHDNYITFNNPRSLEICRINGKWYQYFDLDNIDSNANRESIVNEINNLASSSLAFYRTPTNMGGGGNSWTSNIDNVGKYLGNYDTLTQTIKTQNGLFVLSIEGDILKIVGTGNKIGKNGTDNVKVSVSIAGGTSGPGIHPIAIIN